MTVKLIKLTCLHDFEQLGFYALTGESCGYSMRILFDLSPEAAGDFAAYVGVRREGLNDNWNSSNGAVASAMLPSNCWDYYVHLTEFIARRRHYAEAWFLRQEPWQPPQERVVDNDFRMPDRYKKVGTILLFPHGLDERYRKSRLITDTTTIKMQYGEWDEYHHLAKRVVRREALPERNVHAFSGRAS